MLVLGHGIAGLLVTAVARAAGLGTIAIERRVADRAATPPHASQLHNLLSRGQRELERVLPGLIAGLPGSGIVSARVAIETHVFDAGVRAVERDLGREIWGFPLERLEDAIRSRVETTPDVAITGRAVGLELVAGECVGAWVEVDGEPTLLRAEVVVDAMGASSAAHGWLRDAGVVVPQTVVPVDQWYATAVVREGVAANRFMMVFPSAQETRGGLASPRSDGDYVVSLNGIGAVDAAPRTAQEFAAYARSLPDSAIADLVAHGEVERPKVFRRARAVWNRYDEAQIEGFLAVGDASAITNPLLGQGISAAAWEARALGEAWARSSRADGYLGTAQLIRDATWDLMTVRSPFRFDVPNDEDWSRIAAFAALDAQAHAALIDVWHMLAPVATLHDLARGRLPDGDRDPLWA